MKDTAIRTLMIAVDEALLADLTDVLKQCRVELERSRNREDKLQRELNLHRPLTETQAAEYLGRDLDTLRYYRTLGLDSFKKGASRWYTKAMIDEWLATGRVVQRRR